MASIVVHVACFQVSAPYLVARLGATERVVAGLALVLLCQLVLLRLWPHPCVHPVGPSASMSDFARCADGSPGRLEKLTTTAGGSSLVRGLSSSFLRSAGGALLVDGSAGGAARYGRALSRGGSSTFAPTITHGGVCIARMSGSVERAFGGTATASRCYTNGGRRRRSRQRRASYQRAPPRARSRGAAGRSCRSRAPAADPAGSRRATGSPAGGSRRAGQSRAAGSGRRRTAPGAAGRGNRRGGSCRSA